MIFALAASAAVIAAAGSAPPSSSATVAPALAVVFHIAPPASDDAALAAADVALRAPEEIGEPIRALQARPHGHLTFAIDPAYLAALDRAAAGGSALTTAAKGGPGLGARAGELLAILARHRPLDAATSRGRLGARYLTFATAAANASNGDRSVTFSAQDLGDFAAAAAAVVLSESGARMPPSSASDAAFVEALAAADKSVADELRAGVRSGAVELAAIPDGEPVLPLIIDAGGKSATDARIVNIGAASDAGRLATDALHAAASFAHPPTGAGVGFYSPYGAYDDATGPVIKSAGAAYALFSDRVVHGEFATGSEGAVNESTSAELRAYALTVDKGVTLPVLFWDEEGSARVQTAIGASTAMAQQLIAVAEGAAERAHATPSILVIRVDGEGPWSQRSDARDVVTRFVETIASGSAGASTTPGAFVHAHPPAASAYGYPAAAESGSLSLWMGTPDQASLWRALAAARTAAGGDAAMGKPKVRPLLVAAESGVWFSSLDDPMSGAKRLARFRALIADIYRAVGLKPPDSIAPVKAEPGAPRPSPSPSGTPGASPGSTSPPSPMPEPSTAP